MISAFLFLFRVVKQLYLNPKASFVKTKVISHFVCKIHQFKQHINEAETKESNCDRSVQVHTISYWTWNGPIRASEISQPYNNSSYIKL